MVASKLTDSSKFKVTVKPDTDIPAIDLVFLLFVCFVHFLFILFLSIVFFFLSFFVFFVFFSSFLFLFINLRTCINSIYILTRAQHSQASK